MPEVKEPIDKNLTSIFRAPDYLSIESILNQYFSQEFAYLHRYYLPPLAVIKNLHQKEHFERKWLENQLEKFLHEVDRGFFIIDGEGGTGKTTFLAQWAFQQGAIHHFFELQGPFNFLQSAKSSLGAQLIRMFHMSDQIPPDQFEEASRQPSFLHDILIEASRREMLTQQNPKILIVIDGFDEVGLSDGLNEFEITDDLPENVYFIVSQPPHKKKLKTKAPVKNIYLGAESPYHLSELKLFCLGELSKKPFPPSKNRLNSDQLSDILVEKSNGNWLSLIFLIDLVNQIEEDEFSTNQLHSILPDSLCRCYLQAFRNLKEIDHADWYRNLLPLLGVLTTYQEDVTVDLLASYAELRIEDRAISNYLEKTLHNFIATGPDGKFRLKHFSIRDFFAGKLEKGNCSSQEESFLEELVENTRNFHQKFAQEILSEWGGMQEELFKLMTKEPLTPMDRYGIDHLASHLIGAQSITELKSLINMQQVLEVEEKKQTGRLVLPFAKKESRKKETDSSSKYVNSWHQLKLSQGQLFGYLEDVKKAWKTCETVGEQVRYALIFSSVSSLPPQITTSFSIGDQEEKDQVIASLAAYLAKAGDSSEAMNALEYIKNNRWKSQAYIEIANYAPSTSIPAILRFCYILNDTWAQTQIIQNCSLRLADLRKLTQALETAQQIPVEQHRNQLLAQLAAKFFDENQIDLAMDAIHSIKNDQLQVDLLSQYTELMERESLLTALMMVQGIRNNVIKAQGLTRLAPNLPNPLLKETIRLCQQINDEENRGIALAGVIPYLNDSLLKDAIAAIREIKDENLRAPTLVALTIRTAEAENPEKAFKLIPAILGENPKATAIAGIASFLNEDLRVEAFAMAQKFKDPMSQVVVLESLIPYLNEPVLKEILSAAINLKNEGWQKTILGALGKRYIEINEPSKAIELIQLCKSHEHRIKLITDLTPLLPENTRGQSLAIAQAFDLPAHRASALLGIAPFLAGDEFTDAISSAIAILTQNKLDGIFRVNNLTKILVLLTQQGEFPTALKILQEIQEDSSISQIVVSILPLLPEEYQNIVWDSIDRIQDPSIKISTLVEITPNLPPSQTIHLLRKLQDLGDEKLLTKAIVGLAHHAGQEHLQEILEGILDIDFKELRAQAFKAIISPWIEAPKPFGLFLWKETIFTSAKRARPHLFSDLQALAPIVYHLGGNDAVKEILHATQDITRWWK